MLILYLALSTAFLLLSIFIVFNLFFDLTNYIRGYPPSVPSTKKALGDITSVYEFSPGQKVADCGSGYGSVLMHLRHLPISLTGYEVNPVLCLFSKIRIYPHKNLKVVYKDFLKEDLSKYDVLFIYGADTLTAKLEEKLRKENVKNIRVISNKFPFRSLEHTRKVGDLYLYEL